MKNIYKILNRKHFLLLTIIFLYFFASTTPVEAQSSRGTEFWVAFPRNYYVGIGQRLLYVTSEQNAVVNINIVDPAFSTTLNVVAGTLTTISLPVTVDLSSIGVIQSKGIHITSDNPVTVYAMSQQTATTDAYLALPVDAIGTDYYIMSYSTSIYEHPTSMTIVATEDNTSVNITPRASGGGLTAGVTGNVILNRGQTFYLEGVGFASDYTGSRVTSDKPVSVFGGVRCANIPVYEGACDFIIQQMVPTTAWGESFVTIPLATRLAGDIFRILAQENNTQVSINGIIVSTLNAGSFYETSLSSNSYNRITANKPVLVGQFSKGTTSDNVVSDPFFALVPPDEQFLSNYVVSAGTPNIPNNFLNITSPTSNTGTVKVNGTIVNASAWTAIPGTTFSGARIPVPNGIHNVTSVQPIGLLVYGFGNSDSYGYLGGQAFAAIATVSSITISPLTGSAFVQTNQCREAEVLNQFGEPVTGARVDFTITGPNSSLSGFAFTDDKGIASFCYTGEEYGDDKIDATVGSLSAGSNFTWLELPRAASISITPTTGSAYVNTLQCWEAYVLDQYGDPLAGHEVSFAITGANVGADGTAQTDADGIATFCFTGLNQGDDQIEASAGTFSDVAEFTWQPVVVVEGDAYCTLSQGFFGSETGSDCLGRSPQQVINLSLQALKGITVGSTFPYVLIALPNQASSVILRLPSTGPSVAISAGPNHINGPTELPGIYTWTRGKNAGQMRNSLIGQALTMSLNLGLNPSLALLEIPSGYQYIVTAKADACYDAEASAVAGTQKYYRVPLSVSSYLNGGNGYAGTVQGLLDLANDAISGVSLPGNAPQPGDITTSLEAIIEAFLECRILIGWQMGEINTKSIEVAQQIHMVSTLHVFPNPANAKVTFAFELAEGQQVSLELFNIEGKRKAMSFTGDLQAQQHTITLDVNTLHPGLYFYRLTAGGSAKTGTLMITR
jgi:hypothetical protein